MVISLGGGVRVTPDTQGPLEDLASRLSNEDTEVRVVSQEPEGYGVIFGEVVVIYIVMKAIDNLTDKALDAFFARITEVAKKWARERVQERIDRGAKRVRATYVEPRNEKGEQIGPSVKAEVDSNGVVEITVQEKAEYDFKRLVQFDPSWLEGEEDDGSS
ncbi:MAG: hypothetical protein ABSG36_19660 [Acidimicrobiales bacterium]|jgi:hypothetical protein